MWFLYLLAIAALCVITWWCTARVLAWRRQSARLQAARTAFDAARVARDEAELRIQQQRKADAAMAMKRLRFW